MKHPWISTLIVVALVLLISPAIPTQAAPEISLACTWIGGPTGDWMLAANWKDCNSGAGGVPGATDQVSLTNGGTITISGVRNTTIARLLVDSNTTVNLQASAISSSSARLPAAPPVPKTLTITTGLSVASGSALNMNGTIPLVIFLGAGATGGVSGSMSCATAASQLNAADASAITFNSGAVFTQATGCSGNVFTAAGTANAIVFASGSTFVSQAGGNPFGLSQPNSKVVFQSGSLYRHEQTALAPDFAGRTYANFELNKSGATINGTGAVAVSIDNLTVTDGTLNLGMTGGINLKGNISVASDKTLHFNPASPATLTFNGTAQQTISGAGALTFDANQNVVLNNASGLLLQRDVTLNGTLTLTSGNITTGAYSLILGGTATTADVGDVWGNSKRAGPFTAGTAYAFGNPNVTLKFIDAPPSRIASVTALPTEATVSLADGAPVGFTNAVNRTYTIAATGGGGYSATVRLHYLDSELNGNTEANLVLWRYNGTAWESAGQSAIDTTDNWVELSGVTEFSDWALSDAAPTAVTLGALSATSNGAFSTLPFAGLALFGGLVVLVRRRQS